MNSYQVVKEQQNHPLAVPVLLSALQVGVLGDFLLRTNGLGLNAFLLVAATALIALRLLRREGSEMSRETIALFAVALIFGACFLWRDSEMVKFLNFVVVMTALVLASRRPGEAWLAQAPLGKYLGEAFGAVRAGAAGFISAGQRIDWAPAETTAHRRQAAVVGRGLLLSVPLVAVFGALLMGADLVFAQLVQNTFAFDLPRLAGHMGVVGLLAWPVAGWLGGLVFQDEARPTGTSLRLPRLRIGEIGIALGLLDLLFITFVIVQVKYLFGGASTVEITPGLTYAEYARSGFFELVAVTMLAIPVVLAADGVLERRSVADQWMFRSLAGLLVLLLLVIVASALYRMRLYVSEFGLSEDRFHSTAFMIWLGLVQLWMGATVLWGRRDRFPVGVLVSGLTAAFIMNAINPDARIAQTNVDRLAQGQRFDARYVAYLSADAVPVVVGALDQMALPDRCLVARRLMDRWAAENQPDWRGYSWSPARAVEIVNAEKRSWDLSACPAPGG